MPPKKTMKEALTSFMKAQNCRGLPGRGMPVPEAVSLDSKHLSQHCSYTGRQLHTTVSSHMFTFVKSEEYIAPSSLT